MVSFRWFGQACLEIGNSVTIVTDPHDGESVGLGVPKVKGDIVTLSHRHFDHTSGKKLVSKEDTDTMEGSGEREVKGIKVEGIDSFHDKAEGAKRGENTIFIFEMDGFRICHLGDLGHRLSEDAIGEVKPVDILLVPVGGNYTIGAREAIETVKDLEPSVIIPMHYKVEGLEVEISSEEDFLRLAKDEGWEVTGKDKADIDTLPERKKVKKLACLTA